MPVPQEDLLLWGQIPFFYGSDHDVVRIDHFGEMDFANYGKQLIGIEFGEAIVGMNPAYQLGEGDSHRVIDGTIDARRHDFFFVFEAWPARALPFHEVELQARLHGNFDGATRNFAVAHGGVAITKI